MHHLKVAKEQHEGKHCAPHTIGNKQRLGTTGLLFDASRSEVVYALASVAVTPSEAGILQQLATHRSTPLTREVLLAGCPTPTPALADVCIMRLRRKLAGLGWGGQIRTIAGRGYVLSEPGTDRFPALGPKATIDPAATFRHGAPVQTVPRGRASSSCATAAEGATGPRKRSGSRTAWDMDLWKAGGPKATAPTE